MNFICKLIVLSLFAAVLSATVTGCTYHEHYYMDTPQSITEK